MKDPVLWSRIEQAPFPPGFEEKLRKSCRWKAAFAAEAIAEYRRFVYLSQVSDRRVTPSQAVDLVWHLHLTYSRNYWEDWGRILYRQLHHEPARPNDPPGRFREQYDWTTSLYEAEFATPAPEAIWSGPAGKGVPRWAISAGGAAVLCIGVTTISMVHGQSPVSAIVGGLCVGALVLSFFNPANWQRGGDGCGAACGDGCGD